MASSGKNKLREAPLAGVGCVGGSVKSVAPNLANRFININTIYMEFEFCFAVEQESSRKEDFCDNKFTSENWSETSTLLPAVIAS